MSLYSKPQLFATFEISDNPSFVGAAETREDAVAHVERVRRQHGPKARFVVVGGKKHLVPRPGEES